MDGMRAQLSEIDKAERDLLVTRSKDMESLSTFTQGCLILGGVIGTLMSIILGYLVTQSITKPTMKLLVVSKKMAVGDFNFNLDIESKDEVGTLAKSMGSVQAATQMMVADATTLSKAAVEGKLATRADASKHQGDFRRIQNS
jgi:methyl-accepting chemotaxis protein